MYPFIKQFAPAIALAFVLPGHSTLAKTLEDYEAQGQQLAMQAKGQLGSQLMQALQQGGPTYAVSFCHTQAISITDRVAQEVGAGIKRVSDKPRNPLNQANAIELNVINSMKALLAKGQTLSPVVQEHSETVTGYYPIVTNPMCLNCHGAEGTQIAPETLTVLRTLYPQDKATGYDINQLRGVFVVDMTKSE